MGDNLSELLGLGDRGQETVVGASGAQQQLDGLVRLAVTLIVPNPLQPRSHFDGEELSALAASISEVGMLQPVIVRRIGEHRYELIAGERRWRAAQEAGLEEIPAIVRLADDQSSLEQAVVENLHRADLNGVEEAAAYRQLADDFGLTQDEIAQRVGKSRSAVANTLRLLQLPVSVQRLIMVGELSAGHARALLAVSDSDRQAQLAAKVVADELSVRQVEDLVRRASQGRKAQAKEAWAPAGHRSASMLEIERLLSDRLDTRVSVTLTRNRGRLVVEFADLEDLDRIYRKLDGS